MWANYGRRCRGYCGVRQDKVTVLVTFPADTPGILAEQTTASSSLEACQIYTKIRGQNAFKQKVANFLEASSRWTHNELEFKNREIHWKKLCEHQYPKIENGIIYFCEGFCFVLVIWSLPTLLFSDKRLSFNGVTLGRFRSGLTKKWDIEIYMRNNHSSLYLIFFENNCSEYCSVENFDVHVDFGCEKV